MRFFYGKKFYGAKFQNKARKQTMPKTENCTQKEYPNKSLNALLQSKKNKVNILLQQRCTSFLAYNKKKEDMSKNVKEYTIHTSLVYMHSTSNIP